MDWFVSIDSRHHCPAGHRHHVRHVRDGRAPVPSAQDASPGRLHSSGCIGDVMRAACRLWLKAAARCDVPPDTWPARLFTLFAADQYGAREPLLAYAELLLSEPQLRELVAGIERDLDNSPTPSDSDARPAHGVRCSLTALTLLSRVLWDPDVHVRATLRRSPRPNSMQKQDFVLQYLEVGRPADALPWLEDLSDWHEYTRLRLLAEVFKRLGETERSAPMQQKVFEETLAVEDFRTWLGHLQPHAHAGAVERARRNLSMTLRHLSS